MQNANTPTSKLQPASLCLTPAIQSQVELLLAQMDSKKTVIRKQKQFHGRKG